MRLLQQARAASASADDSEAAPALKKVPTLTVPLTVPLTLPLSSHPCQALEPLAAIENTSVRTRVRAVSGVV